MPKHMKKSAKHEAAKKGLKAAGQAFHSSTPKDAPPGKQKSPVDPTKGLREAIKAKEIEALAMQVASGQ